MPVDWTVELDDGSGGTKDVSRHVIRFETAREHTALSDFRCRLAPPDTDIFTYNFQEARLYVEGTLIFRGEVEKTRNRYDDGVMEVGGRGIGIDLVRSSAVMTYQGTQPVYEAIDSYTTNQTTDWTWTVHTPSTNTVSDDVNHTSATNGFKDQGVEDIIVEGIGEHDPIIITSDKVELAQTAWTTEGEDGTVGSTVSDSNASGGEAGRIFDDSLEVSFTPDYVVPSSNMDLAVRWKKGNGYDGDIFFDFDGTEVGGPRDPSTIPTSFGWGGGNNSNRISVGSDVSEGASHTVTIRSENRTQGHVDIDVVAPHDDRFTYNFDNTLDANDALAGPEHYPPGGYEVLFDDTDYGFNIERVAVDATWDDVGGDQQYRVSVDNGSNYVTQSNTADFDVDMQGQSEYGTQLEILVTFDSYGTQTSTPTDNANAQRMTFYESTVTENDLAIIEGSKKYEGGSHLANLQELHRDAGMRFVIDHTKESSLEAESFMVGDQQKTADWTPTNQSEDRDSRDYYNEVEVYGPVLAGGGRDSEVITWQNEVDRVGETIKGEIVRPSLDNAADRRMAARRWLVMKIENDKRGADVRIVPQVVKPGYEYSVQRSVDSFDASALECETVQFVLSQDSEEGVLRFGKRGGSTELITGNRNEIEENRRAI